MSATPPATAAATLVAPGGVVDRPRASVFATVPPAALVASAAAAPDRAGLLVTALRRAGVSRFQAPGAVVVAGEGVVPTVRRDGWIGAAEPAALGVAIGAALAAEARHPGTRTWSVQQLSSLWLGPTMEAAAVAGTLRPAGLVATFVGAAARAEDAAALLSAVGWQVLSADDGDAWSLLAALDHAMGDEDVPAQPRRRLRAVLSLTDRR